MDIAKYPDRLTCGVNQYVGVATYIFTKYADYTTVKIESRIERQQEVLSGVLNNFQTGVIK